VEYGLARVRHHTSGFLSWWFGELKALLPPRLTRLLSPPVNELVLELIAQKLMLRRRDGGAERELGTVQVEGVDPEAAKAALRPLIADLDLHRVMVSLGLPAELALRKLVDLPAAAEENLRQVLAFEMDRLTPFPADAVQYDVRVIDRNLENRRIRVELMVLPRAAVDPTVQLLHRLGLEPDVVALPRGSHEQTPWRLPLASNGSGERRFVNRVPVAFLALAAALLVAAVYTAFDRQRARAELLEREVDMARKEAEEGRRLQEQIEQLSAEGSFIVDKKRARPPVVQVLNELTRALPDDTWLYRLRLINEELQTFGYSPNASAMIGHIENSALFGNAQFRAPLTRDQRVDAEQFHIAFQVATEKAQ
jgi:general secretion pathway protein L